MRLTASAAVAGAGAAGAARASASPAAFKNLMATLLVCGRQPCRQAPVRLPMQLGTSLIVNYLVGNAQIKIRRQQDTAARSRRHTKEAADRGAARIRQPWPCRRQG